MSALETLTAAYRAVHRLPDSAPLPDSASAQLTMMAQSVEASRAGLVSFGWSLASAMQWVFDSAKATTQIAVLSYGFLTNVSLGPSGLDYLVSAAGPNPNNLNSAYYQGFSLENRYINFAVSLVKEGEAKEAFLARYGESASLHETVRMAWLQLFGAEKPVGEIADLLSEQVPNGRGGVYTRGEYFAEIAGEPNADALGARAAAVGWLMAEAAKAGQGPYVQATRAFLADLAIDGSTPPTNAFLSLYGPGGDLAPGGAADPGLRGESASFERDWDVSVAKPSADSPVRALATEGNDTLTSAAAGYGGLDAGRHIFTGGGNDTISSSNGAMRGHIDAGPGNDQVYVDGFEGRITTGAGYDSIVVRSFGQLPLGGSGELGDLAVVTDFQLGRDLIQFSSALGAGKKGTLTFPAPPTLDEAVAAYAATTAPGENTVFELGGDTYIFHQDEAVGLGAGDGLVRLAGVVGLSVANGPQAPGDIVFGA